MTNNSNNLDVPATYTGNKRVMVGNGQSLPILNTSFVSNLAPQSSLLLSNVLVVPGIKKKKLISISQITNKLIVVSSLILLVLSYRIIP
jgi:hypothetical protein